MYRATIPANDFFKRTRGANAHLNFLMFDSPLEAVEYMQGTVMKLPTYKVGGQTPPWAGGTLNQTLDWMRNGEESAVKASDALLSKYEHMFKITGTKFTTIDDVAGSVPNVPAYLAGHPLTMRRRQRHQSEQAPLVVTVDTMPSAGVSVDAIKERGNAILALVRILSSVRPIELWAGSCNAPSASNAVTNCFYVRIDTAPMDLAKASFLLAHPAFPRQFHIQMTGNAMELMTVNDSFAWGFGDVGNFRKMQHGMFQTLPAFHGRDLFCIPNMYLDDEWKSGAERWLKNSLKKYGGEMFQDLAA